MTPISSAKTHTENCVKGPLHKQPLTLILAQWLLLE